MEFGPLKVPFSTRLYKIEAIKRLRKFCEETYGVAPGLKEAKEFVESFQDHSHYAVVTKPKLEEFAVKDLVQALQNRGYTVMLNEQR